MTSDQHGDAGIRWSLLGLTAVTGVVDAVSFLGLGHIFTANMTGNVVFLGFALGAGTGVSVARSLTALSAFAPRGWKGRSERQAHRVDRCNVHRSGGWRRAARKIRSGRGAQYGRTGGRGIIGVLVLDYGMSCCSRCGSSPSHAGFCAVPSKMDEVLKGSNSPSAAAVAVLDSSAGNSGSLKGRNVRAASHA